MKQAVLLRVEYPYGKSQVWLPTDLHKVAGRLDSVGIKTDVVDLNLEPIPEDLQKYNYVGIGVIGAPYIPRARKLVQEVKVQTRKAPLIGGPGVEYLTNEELAILRWIYRFPEVIENAAKNFSPNLLCSYLFELAKRFNTFYAECPILSRHSGEPKATPESDSGPALPAGRRGQNDVVFRLALTQAVSIVLKNGLTILGIEAVEKM